LTTAGLAHSPGEAAVATASGQTCETEESR
jgi:hypothetical protein